MIGKKLRCSFCGKDQDDVKKLVAGAKAFICNECVAIADRIMKEAPDSPDQAPDKPAAWPKPRK
jgi:ATP-dependent Clp protease ATP-binding subunit ClpX